MRSRQGNERRGDETGRDETRRQQTRRELRPRPFWQHHTVGGAGCVRRAVRVGGRGGCVYCRCSTLHWLRKRTAQLLVLAVGCGPAQLGSAQLSAAQQKLTEKFCCCCCCSKVLFHFLFLLGSCTSGKCLKIALTTATKNEKKQQRAAATAGGSNGC